MDLISSTIGKTETMRKTMFYVTCVNGMTSSITVGAHFSLVVSSKNFVILIGKFNFSTKRTGHRGITVSVGFATKKLLTI